MSWLAREWNSVKSWATNNNSETASIMVELELWEHGLLQKFHPLFRQIACTLGNQGIQIIETALAGAMATATTGGNIGAGIAAAAKTAEVTALADASLDAKNAVYGILAATAASLPAQPSASTS